MGVKSRGWMLLPIACALSGSLIAASQPATASAVETLAAEYLSRAPGSQLDGGFLLRTEAQAKADAVWAGGFLDRLHRLSPQQLRHDEWITYATLEYDAGLLEDAAAFYWFETPVTPYASRGLAGTFASRPVATDADRQSYLDALNALPVTFAALEAKLRGQAQRGIVLPQAEIDLVVPYMRGFGGRGAQSPFAVQETRLSGLPAAARTTFLERVNSTLDQSVAPAVERLAAYIDGPYRAQAGTEVGVGRLPGGRDYYRYLIRRHTGLDLTAEQIHQIGLDEVARLEKELDTVRQRLGYSGSLAEFHQYLRTDPKFRAKSSAEIGERMMAAIHRIEPKVGDAFTVRPEALYGVRPIDPQQGASMTYGYYQVPTATDPTGYYLFNGTHPEERSILMADAVIYHELVPGHHFQIALQRENQGLSAYRRATQPTAFTEGWGEYASDLAGEMGMYTDPLQRAGRLAMDLFLSTRLVVDTGMNALGWSRERAMAYMKEHIFESDLQIATESLRYSSDIPGQALAYKLGSREILRQRQRAAAALGTRFDLRAFHRYVLTAGAMPLPVLAGHIDCFIQERHPVR